MADGNPLSPTPEELLEAIALVEAVARWQLDTLVHPLTCGTESDHRPLLLPRWNSEQQRVELWCAECDYVQVIIPDCVLAHGPEHVRKSLFRS